MNKMVTDGEIADLIIYERFPQKCYFCNVGVFVRPISDSKSEYFLQPDLNVMRICSRRKCWERFKRIRHTLKTTKETPFILHNDVKTSQLVIFGGD